MKKKLCIFDMDGLLIDSEKGMWFVNEEKALAILGYEYDNSFFRTLMGRAFNTCEKELKEKYGNDFPFIEFYDLVNRLNREQIQNNEIKLMPGVVEFLEYLKDKEISCVVGTSTEKDMAKNMLKNLGILDYFTEVYSGTQVKNPKPAPDIVLLCLGDYAKEESFIFEDSHNGARAGIASGIDTIIVEDVALITAEDRKEAFAVIKQLDEAIKFI